VQSERCEGRGSAIKKSEEKEKEKRKEEKKEKKKKEKERNKKKKVQTCLTREPVGSNLFYQGSGMKQSVAGVVVALFSSWALYFTKMRTEGPI